MGPIEMVGIENIDVMGLIRNYVKARKWQRYMGDFLRESY